jgi:hypothetical protein
LGVVALSASLVIALTLVVVGALYIRLRWQRSPSAYSAMIVLSVGYFVAGALVMRSALHIYTPGPTTAKTPAGSMPNVESTTPVTSPVVKENYTGPSFSIPGLHYDPAHAALPDPKLTPGDTIPNVTADDVCTPGWAHEHRHVTEGEKGQVYAEYHGSQQTCVCPGGGSETNCCEVDHLIPLELGGSNDVKNLWPQPQDPRPGWPEKDSLENDLHERVCKGEMSLADAQKCIASNWVKCWEKYVVPEYGPQWAAANRHGW